MPTGTSMAYVASNRGVDLPAPTHSRAAHKPWCADCKRTIEPLDNDQRCERCARAHITRTAAAERRAHEEAERAAAAKAAPPAPTKLAKNPRRRGPHSTFNIDEALTRFATGEDATSIAEDLGTTAGNLYSHASRRGIRSGQNDTPTPRTKRPTDTQELDAQCAHAADLLRRTWNSTHPATKALRTSALAALEALHLVAELHPDTTTAPVPAATAPPSSAAGTVPTSADRNGKGKPTRSAGTTGRETRRDKIHLPTPDVEDAYQAGTTIRALADQYDVSAPTIARHLDEHGVVRRKQKVDYTPELIEAVRTRYIDQGMTQDQVAADLNITSKVVHTAMARGNVTARDTNGPGVDRAEALRGRLDHLGATSRQVKAWALHIGLIERITPGIPSAHLVEAYANAHPTTQGDNAA